MKTFTKTSFIHRPSCYSYQSGRIAKIDKILESRGLHMGGSVLAHTYREMVEGETGGCESGSTVSAWCCCWLLVRVAPTSYTYNIRGERPWVVPHLGWRACLQE